MNLRIFLFLVLIPILSCQGVGAVENLTSKHGFAQDTNMVSKTLDSKSLDQKQKAPNSKDTKMASKIPDSKSLDQKPKAPNSKDTEGTSKKHNSETK